MAKILSIEEASEFYNIVLPYLPEERPEEIITFAGKIVNAIPESGNYSIYLKLLKMLTDIDENELDELGGVELFIEGLVENRIFLMKDYFNKVGFGHD